MADNISVTPGSGKTVAADEISSVLYQRVKPAWGPDGTANDVAPGATTKSASLSVCIATDEARANVVDTAASHKAVEVIPTDDYVYVAGVAYPVLRAVINESSSGDQEIIAAVSSKKIRVIKYSLTVASAVVLTWKRASTAISGPMDLSAGIVEPECRSGIMDTGTSEALNLNLSAGVQVSGYILYVAYTP